MKNDGNNPVRLVFTAEEVRELLGLSRGLVYEAIKRGDIPSVRIGRRILVPRAALQRLLLEGVISDCVGRPRSSPTGGGQT